MKKKLFLLAFACISFSLTYASTEKNVETKTVTSLEISPFCKLIRQGNYDAVKAMIDNGEDINKKSTGLTPLMFAARYNKVEIVKLLIERGVKLKVKSDRMGYTALQWAKRSKANECWNLINNALKNS